jgi:hypothetical protein
MGGAKAIAVQAISGLGLALEACEDAAMVGTGGDVVVWARELLTASVKACGDEDGRSAQCGDRRAPRWAPCSSGLRRRISSPAFRLVSRAWPLRRSLKEKPPVRSTKVVVVVGLGACSATGLASVGWPAAFLGSVLIIALAWTISSADRTRHLASLIRTARSPRAGTSTPQPMAAESGAPRSESPWRVNRATRPDCHAQAVSPRGHPGSVGSR